MTDDPVATAAPCVVCQVGGVGRLDIDGPACAKCGMGWDACYDREHDGWCCAECHHHVACDCRPAAGKSSVSATGTGATVRDGREGR